MAGYVDSLWQISVNRNAGEASDTFVPILIRETGLTSFIALAAREDLQDVVAVDSAGA